MLEGFSKGSDPTFYKDPSGFQWRMDLKGVRVEAGMVRRP